MSAPLSRRQIVKLAGGAVAALSASATLRQSARAAVASYDFVDIGVTQPAGDFYTSFLVPTYISNGGIVVGSMWISDEKSAPYLYQDSNRSRIRTSTYGARITAMNDAGVVVGRELTGIGNDRIPRGRPARWVNGKKDLLPIPADLKPLYKNCEVWDINAAGQTIGNIQLVDGSINPVIWYEEEPVLLPAAFDGVIVHEARTINDNGVVAGIASDAELRPHTITWQDGAAASLYGPESDEGYITAGPGGTNGAFAGATLIQGIYQPAIWRAGEVEVLASPQSAYAEAFAAGVNQSGTACGTLIRAAEDARENWEAVTWQEGVCYELSSLTAVPDGVRLVSATSINDPGQIVGGAIWSDGSLHGYLLNPR